MACVQAGNSQKYVLCKIGKNWYNSFVATVAQLVEQAFRKRQVKGPNPFGGLNGNEMLLYPYKGFWEYFLCVDKTDVITLSRLMGHSGLDVLKRYLNQLPDDFEPAHGRASPVDNAF